MRTLDVVQAFEQERRASALVAWAFCADTAISDNAMKAFEARGFEDYAWRPRGKSVMSATDEAIALQPLRMAFVSEVERVSVTGQLVGAVRVPLGAFARIQVGVIEAVPIGEGQVKPVARLDFDVAGGAPSKVIAQIIVSSEWTRAVDGPTQDAIRQQLVSACAARTDADFVTAITTGLSPVTGDVGDLLAAISQGAPAKPYIIGSYAELFTLAGKLRDLRDLGVGILATPASAGKLIAIDAAGLLIADGGAEVATARHATMTFSDGGSPAQDITVNLWQSNLTAIRAERWLKFATRAGAAAYLEVGA